MRPAQLTAPLAALLLAQALLAQAPPAPPAPPEPPAAPERGGRNLRVERRTEPLASGSKLWIRNRNGAIKVTGWEKEEVDLTAEIRDTGRRPIHLVVQRKGADLDIEAVSETPRLQFGFVLVRSPSCELTLSVPRRVLAHLRTTNGALQVTGVEGYARCETTNGGITLVRVAGEVLAETTNGTIDARQLQARIKGGTTNGRILLDQVAGGIRLETTNGGIRARGLDGWGEGIHLETTNGDIDLELDKAEGEVVAANSNGSLDIRLPGAQVVEQTKHRAHLRFPGKSQKIALETTNGSIRVR